MRKNSQSGFWVNGNKRKFKELVYRIIRHDKQILNNLRLGNIEEARIIYNATLDNYYQLVNKFGKWKITDKINRTQLESLFYDINPEGYSSGNGVGI